MSEHPYKHLPDSAFWRRAMEAAEIDPAGPAPFQIGAQDQVVTAGSCFAQHIGPLLRDSGFAYLETETAHPMAPPELARSFGYGLFSARYGNVYTARQLLQLLQRAFGDFYPAEDVWVEGGCWIDPFRPQIQPGGFASAREYELDRRAHFAAVRRAVTQLDVLVFTLGLTEAWVSRLDGAVFPLCPGVAGGSFAPARHALQNFSAQEVAADLGAAVDLLRRHNPRARVILTVSPVPLVATAQPGMHVLAATMAAKATLLVAARMAAQARPGLAYFPSYEIIMSGAFGPGTWFEPDRRSVTAQGVAQVMRSFARSFTGAPPAPPGPAPGAAPTADATLARMEALMKLHCDELALDPG